MFSQRKAIALTLFVIAGAMLLGIWMRPAYTVRAATSFQYKEVPTDIGSVATQANKYGEQGWEVVQVFTAPNFGSGHVELLLKKTLP